MLEAGKYLTVIIGMAWYGSCQGIELDELEFEEVYLSPTRLKQSPHDIPASVSRVTQETIRDLQINSIPELLKYVAGMISGNASGTQPRINYHGTNGLIPRRMQVLLDGISVYRPSYAEVSWPTLAISIHDVDVVEVTRSPSTASYGANSMMAVINIKTKDPYDVSTFGGVGTIGGQGTKAADIYTSGELSDDVRYRLSVSSAKNDGYDKNFRGEERRDGTDAKRINGKLAYRVNANTEGELFLGYSDVMTELEFRDSNQQSFPDITTESFFAMSDLRHSFSVNHEIKLKAYYTHVEQDMEWNTCYPAILLSENLRQLHLQNPGYAEALANQQFPTGGSAEDDAIRDAVLAELSALGANAFAPLCGWVNEDGIEKKFDIEVEDTLIVSDNLRLVSGIGAMRQSGSSETFLDGTVSVNSYRAFGNAEYRWGDFVFNLGGMIEDEERSLDKPAFSPRLGINYRLTDATTLRMVFSKAVRTPDIIEHDGNWSYFSRGLEPAYPLDGRESAYFYFNAKADGEIGSEEIFARELSIYSSKTFAMGSGMVNQVLDVKYFHDSLSNLVSEKLQFFDYQPTNDGEVTLQGVEIDANMTLNDVVFPEYLKKVRLHLNYAYMDSDTDEFYERSLDAQHSGAAYAIFNFHGGWLSSIAYYGNSAINGEAFDGWELGLGRTTRLGKGDLLIKGKAVYWPDKEDSFVVSETFNVKNINEDSTTFYLTLDYSFR
ncbi:MAG: TonB-dependent receptor [Candidatus Thiodiazotropha sp. (ex Dulcina madagascariensis)]|nr:TonB-dependent receptor [Candidatus Thiodiazotropha sp. (ex Dulcina madagascariensis)]